MLIFGLDIGTTSVGSAVIRHDQARGVGEILHLGVRIFPEARDPDGTPLNQQRRQKRLVRRQLRRRRERRKALNQTLAAAGLLPPFGCAAWGTVMASEPLALRARGLVEPLAAHEFGRALYHLAQRRHFRERDLEESEKPQDAEAKKASDSRASMLARLRKTGETLGQCLSDKGPLERKRGVHVVRSTVLDEFDRLWRAQAAHHAILRDPALRAQIEDVIFAQRPVFWRKSTLGGCRLMPGEELCARGSWLSQQRRMLEKLNNLALASGNARPLDDEERGAILERLQTQGSMSWPGVRACLKPIFKARGEPGRERSLRFNLEDGGDPNLPGNLLEARLSAILADGWAAHPHRQAIRDTLSRRLRDADYGEIGDQRVVIRSEAERRQRRAETARSFVEGFGVTEGQAANLAGLELPTGWEPFSTAALTKLLPHLERGVRFGALLNGPEWADWRAETFPLMERPTGEVLDRLPSPADKDEQRRLAAVRNPTVVRVQNELRKVVNNLIGLYGKPDLIRVELAREVGKSKRERDEMQAGQRRQEKRRRDAVADLRSKGIEPSRADIEKWLLWHESQKRCPYTGDCIGFDGLFRNGEYEVEHIWPRQRSLDDSLANKTLCRRDVNAAKGNKTPFEHFEHRTEEWTAIVERVRGMMASKGGVGMSPGKVKRFLAQTIPEGFASRQLNDTGFAARQTVAFLRRLWPDLGAEAPVNVQPVSGRVTAQLRRLWGLNNVLAEDGEKTRADHRHHAVDALVVACTDPRLTAKLSSYWQAKDDPKAPKPSLSPLWPNIRADADWAVAQIVVSHRVRKKLSGPLHKETVYGDTGQDEISGKVAYRRFVTRKKVEALGKGELNDIRDPAVRERVKSWVQSHAGDPKKAFATYPRLGDGGPEIRKVRLTSKQQLTLMAKVSTGYADLGSNHHVAIYRLPTGAAIFEVVSLLEAMRRQARREPIVRRARDDGAAFVMSLSANDTIRFAKEKGQPATLWRVQKIASKGQISLLHLTDAIPKDPPSLFEPTVAGILQRGAVKLSVDPIGRIRPAND